MPEQKIGINNGGFRREGRATLNSLVTTPLPISSEGVSYRIASDVAKRYRVILDYADTGRGEDETIMKPVFRGNYIYLRERESVRKRLEEAATELDRRLNKLAELSK